MNYAEQLKHGSWAERRLRIMERDDFACVRCRSKKNLNVHHKVYKKNRFAWQYPDKDLETLCYDCHYKEHFKKPIAPAKVWAGIDTKQENTDLKAKILHLEEKLKEPISDELQEQILIKLIELKKKNRITYG